MLYHLPSWSAGRGTSAARRSWPGDASSSRGSCRRPTWSSNLRYAAALVGRLPGTGRGGPRRGASWAARPRARWATRSGEMRNELVLGFLALSLGDAAAGVRAAAARSSRGCARAASWSRASSPPSRSPRRPWSASATWTARRRWPTSSRTVGRRLDRPWARVTAARCDALAAAAAGDLGGALDRIARADPDDRRLGDPFERARTRLVQGTLLRRAKKRGAARTAIEDGDCRLHGDRDAVVGRSGAGRARAARPASERRRADRDRVAGRRARRLGRDQPGDRRA